jgi:hypothetical protein
MMNRLALIVALVMLCAAVLGGVRAVSGQAVLTPNAEDVRYQLIGNEPIAGPDGFSLVKDWSALMFKDRRSGDCYLAFARGSAISAVNVAQCPGR